MAWTQEIRHFDIQTAGDSTLIAALNADFTRHWRKYDHSLWEARP